MRDEPSDAPIPERFEPSDYHVNALSKAKEALARLASLSADEVSAECLAEYHAEHARHSERAADCADQLGKYQAMLAQVNSWEPPTSDHKGFKKFMVEQLTTSIDFDCNMSYDKPPALSTANEWHAQAIAKAQRDIEYHSKALAEEIDRTSQRNHWLKALRNSLRTPAQIPAKEHWEQMTGRDEWSKP